MSQPIDVTSDLFKLHAKTASAASDIVVKKPKSIKIPGNCANAVVISKRMITGTNGSQEIVIVLIFGDFTPNDVNVLAGEYVSPDEILLWVFEQHLMDQDELKLYKETHKGSIGNRKYSDLVKQGQVSLSAMSLIEVSSFTPWTVDGRAVAVGDYVRLMNLRREVRQGDGRIYNSWKCESVASLKPTDYQLLENRARIEAARTALISLRHTELTEKMPYPEELAHQLIELGAAGSQYAIRDIERVIRWHQATPQQRAFMDRAVSVPFEGIGEVLARKFGTLITGINFKAEKMESFKDGKTVVGASISGTAFATQQQTGGKLVRVQLCMSFSRETVARIGICHGPNLLLFAERLLKGSHGAVWAAVDAQASTTEMNIAHDDDGEPLADYALWLDVKLMAFDLASSIMNSAIEITEELARHITMNPEQKKVIEANAATHPLKYSDPVYEATGSQSGIDPSTYRYFLLHPDIDETKRQRLDEIMKEKQLSAADIKRELSMYLMRKAPEGTFKQTDFKRLVMTEEKLATVFGVKLTECERVEKGIARATEAELVEIFDDALEQNQATMASFIENKLGRGPAPAIMAAPTEEERQAVEEQESSEQSESAKKRRSSSKRGGGAKRVKTAGPILDD